MSKRIPVYLSRREIALLKDGLREFEDLYIRHEYTPEMIKRVEDLVERLEAELETFSED